MTVQRATEVPASPAAPTQPSAPPEFPVREYIGAMALELGQMARWDGDETLARLLDSAAALAGEPLRRAPVETVDRVRRRQA